LGTRKKSDGASDNLPKKVLDPLETLVEVPCRLQSDAPPDYFAKVVAQTSPQSSSCSVPLTKVVDI
jgi:hypothetical protein